MKDRNRVRVLKIFDSKRLFGEFQYFSYQWAFGVSVRYLTCEGMGWMFRFYFGPFKIWVNLTEKKRETTHVREEVSNRCDWQG